MAPSGSPSSVDSKYKLERKALDLHLGYNSPTLLMGLNPRTVFPENPFKKENDVYVVREEIKNRKSHTSYVSQGKKSVEDIVLKTLQEKFGIDLTQRSRESPDPRCIPFEFSSEETSKPTKNKDGTETYSKRSKLHLLTTMAYGGDELLKKQTAAADEIRNIIGKNATALDCNRFVITAILNAKPGEIVRAMTTGRGAALCKRFNLMGVAALIVGACGNLTEESHGVGVVGWDEVNPSALLLLASLKKSYGKSKFLYSTVYMQHFIFLIIRILYPAYVNLSEENYMKVFLSLGPTLDHIQGWNCKKDEDGGTFFTKLLPKYVDEKANLDAGLVESETEDCKFSHSADGIVSLMVSKDFVTEVGYENLGGERGKSKRRSH